MDKSSLTKSLWDTANLITGFAVVQTATFTYACTNKDFADKILEIEVKIIISIIMLFMTAMLSWAVWWCSKKQTELISHDSECCEPEVLKIIRQAAMGRIALIILLLIPVFLALYSTQIASLYAFFTSQN